MTLGLFAKDAAEFFPQEGTSFWECGAEQIRQSAAPENFQWGNREQTLLRYVRNKQKDGDQLLWQGHRIWEMLIKFNKTGKKPETVTISIHNRGDDRNMTKRDFDALLEEVQTQTAEWAHATAPPRKERIHLNRSSVNSLVWGAPENGQAGSPQKVRLLWCISDRGPEYLTLRITAPGVLEEPLRSMIRADVSKKNLPSKVQTLENGSRYLDVPMINQGDKGYCAAASVARILQYYGSEADMNQIAQLLGTDAQAGTTYEHLLGRLQKSKDKLKIRPAVLYEWKDLSGLKQFQQFISRYNRAARAAKAQTVKINMRDPDLTLQSLSPEIVRTVRLQDRNLARFRREVRNAIDKGIPVLWLISGHARLINGYDAAKDEILYSDSWGAEHECKNMETGEAFIMTVKILTLEPR